MEKGVLLVGNTAMRKDPDEASEMVSQVLFGEQFNILDSRGTWLLVRLDFDGYQGWIIKKAIGPIQADQESGNSQGNGFRMVSQICVSANDKLLNKHLYLPAGSILPGISGKNLLIYGREWELLSEEGILLPGPDVDPESIGMGLLSVPYLWGGRSGFGFDCSGFTQMLMRMVGITIPRDSSQQADLGTTVNFMNEVCKGDLAFFNNSNNEISHVGMATGNGKILHASVTVRLDKLDQHGIYNDETKDYTHKLRLIKRVMT